MKNALFYFYDLSINDIHQEKDNYYFTYNQKNYILQIYELPIEEIDNIYILNQEMLRMGIPCHKIILTKFNNILVLINKKNYILLEMQVNNRSITYKDIENFKFRINNISHFKKIDKSNWHVLWSEKIDFIEYQFRQIEHKYKIIKKSINYFIGLAENAISYYNYIDLSNMNLYISHRRIKENDDLINFYNPLNLVIDFKERDIAEYIKNSIINNNFNYNNFFVFLDSFKTKEEIMIFITRMLYPSIYFDIYERVVVNNENEEAIKKIIDKYRKIEIFISRIFKYYYEKNTNIILINWIIDNNYSL